MPNEHFPTKRYLETMVGFLDTISYNDTNYTSEVRTHNLHHVYSKAAEHFAQPVQQRLIKASPRRLQAYLQTIVAMVVYSYVKVTPDVMADLTIHYTYTLILDDSKDGPEINMKSFYEDLLAGRHQQHPWWRMVNDHFPAVLRHYGPFCALNLVSSTLDFFEGCWIEQYNFQGYPGSYDYPTFLRRLNGLGHCVGASLFPRAEFDEVKLFTEIASVIAQLENWMIFVNDLMSFYKEFDEPRDQTSLVNNYARCDSITIDEALNKLTRDCIADSEQIVAVFKDKNSKLTDSVFSFCQGYLTWHLCDPRYRLKELWDCARDDPTGLKFRQYQQAGADVGAVNPKKWAYPSVSELAETENKKGLAAYKTIDSLLPVLKSPFKAWAASVAWLSGLFL